MEYVLLRSLLVDCKIRYAAIILDVARVRGKAGERWIVMRFRQTELGCIFWRVGDCIKKWTVAYLGLAIFYSEVLSFSLARAFHGKQSTANDAQLALVLLLGHVHSCFFILQ